MLPLPHDLSTRCLIFVFYVGPPNEMTAVNLIQKAPPFPAPEFG